MTIGVIETIYGGCRFRSRLEARWAVFFDKLGIEWKYETEGYEVNGNRYLPDFYLPKSNDWVEVKGDPHGLNRERMTAILGEDSPLPGFARGEAALLILGEIPTATTGTVLHQALTRAGISCRTADLSSAWFFFSPKGGGKWAPGLIPPTFVLTLFGREFQGGIDVIESAEGWRVRHEVLPTVARFGAVFDAYTAARHARFEYGAHGA
jgi:hypothetical protein